MCGEYTLSATGIDYSDNLTVCMIFTPICTSDQVQLPEVLVVEDDLSCSHMTIFDYISLQTVPHSPPLPRFTQHVERRRTLLFFPKLLTPFTLSFQSLGQLPNAILTGPFLFILGALVKLESCS
jgi:hypothetical protein